MIDQNKVQNLCNKYKINYKIFPNKIHMETALNTWICEDNTTHYRLKHKNKGVCKHTMHMHDRKFENVNEVLEYIHTHDTKTIFDRRRSVERRLDKLLSEISISIHSQPNKNINRTINI
jgi:hypothetical protein